MAIVGTAYVAIKAISNEAAVGKQIADEIKKAGKDPAVDQAAKAVGDDIGKDIGKSSAAAFSEESEKSWSTAVEKLGEGADDAGDRLGRDIADSSAEGFEDQSKKSWATSVDGLTDRVKTSWRGVGEDIGDDLVVNISESVDRDRDSWRRRGLQWGKDTVSGFGEGFSDAARNLQIGGMWAKQVIRDFGDGLSELPDRIAGTLSSGIGGLMRNPYVLGAIVSLGLSLAGTLGPAIGAAIVSAVPVAVAALAGAGGIFGAIGLAVVSNLTVLKNEMDDLLDRWKGLGEAIGDTVLPPILDTLDSITSSLLPTLETAFGFLTDDIILMGNAFANMFASTSVQNALIVLTQHGGALISTLVIGFADVTEALIKIGAAASPVIDRFAGWIARAADSFGDFIDRAAASGELQAFFDDAADTASALWDVIVAIGHAIAPLFDPSNASAGALEGLAAGFEALAPMVDLLVQIGVAIGNIIALISQTGIFDPFISFITGAAEAVSKFSGFIEWLGIGMDDVADSSASAASGMGTTAAAIGSVTSSLITNTETVEAATEAWDKFGTEFDKAEDALQRVHEGWDKLDKIMKDDKATIDQQKSAVRDQAAAIRDNAAAQLANGETVDVVSAKYKKQRAELEEVAIKMFGNKKKAKEYVDQLLLTPEQMKTRMELDTSAAKQKFETFKDKYSGQTIVLPATMKITSATISVSAQKLMQIPTMAAGGVVEPVPGGTLVAVAEAGQAERIEPLDARGLSARDYSIVRALVAELGGKGGGGGGPTEVRVFIGDEELRDMIRSETVRRENATAERIKIMRSTVGVGTW